MFRVLRVAQPLIGYPGAAGEAYATVNDQRFTMRAVVDAVDRVPAQRMIPALLAENCEICSHIEASFIENC